MKTGFGVVHRLTQAQIDAGEALNISGARIEIIDATGLPTGVVYESGAAGVAPSTLATAATIQQAVAAGAAIPDWQASFSYSVNDVVRATVTVGTMDLGDIIRRSAAGTSGATFDATEAANWTNLGAELVRSVSGKTGTVTLVKADVGLNLADNTADVSKPLSLAAFNATYSDNLCFNGGADRSSLDGWVAESGTLTLAADTTDKQKGDASFKITGTATGGFCSRAIPVKPGEKYIVSLDVKGSGAVSNGLYIRMNEAVAYPAAGDNISIGYRANLTELFSNGAVSSAWESRQYIYTVPAGYYWASLVILKWTGASAVSLNFDNVEVRRLLPQAGVDLTNASTTVAGLMSSTDKTKLDGVAAGAEINVNADWGAVSGDAQILNKPATMTPAAHTHPEADVTNLVTDLAGKAASIHTHAQADVTDLTTALSDAKIGVGTGTTIGGKGVDVSPHNMTANNAPAPYVASASTFYTGFDPYKAFGGTPAPYWLSGNGIVLPHWLGIDLGSAKTLFSYAVQVNSVPEPNRAPQAWTCKGSNSNVESTATVIDTRTAQTAWTSGEIREFILATQVSYRYYWINISANNGDPLTQVGELYLYDASGLITIPAIPVYSSNEAALAGGLAVGKLYRSNGNPDVVSVVH